MFKYVRIIALLDGTIFAICEECRDLLDLSGSEIHESSTFMSLVESCEVGASN